MNSLVLLPLILLAASPDSSLARIRARYATVQAQLAAKRCLQWKDSDFEAFACPDGAVAKQSRSTDSGTIDTEWRLDGDTTRFVLVREKLPGKRVRETRIYRMDQGVHLLTRSGPTSTIQNLPQVPGGDTSEALELVDQGQRLWASTGIAGMDFPFSAVTARGMVLVEENTSITTKSSPEVSAREATWPVRAGSLDPWYRQILGKRFCEIGGSACAVAQRFVLLSGRTPHFGEAQSDPPMTDEDLLQRHLAAMPPALMLELSSPLSGAVALEDFAPLELASDVPERFREHTDRRIRKEIGELDESYRGYLKDHPDEGPSDGADASWSNAPGYQEKELTFAFGKGAIHLFGASSGEDCTSVGFFETLKLGFALDLSQAEAPRKPSGSTLGAKSKRKLDPISIEYPCEPNYGCTLGPAFLPWNRRQVHLHGSEWSEHEWIRELDESFRWILRQDFRIPFQDCGC